MQLSSLYLISFINVCVTFSPQSSFSYFTYVNYFYFQSTNRCNNLIFVRQFREWIYFFHSFLPISATICFFFPHRLKPFLSNDFFSFSEILCCLFSFPSLFLLPAISLPCNDNLCLSQSQWLLPHGIASVPFLELIMKLFDPFPFFYATKLYHFVYIAVTFHASFSSLAFILSFLYPRVPTYFSVTYFSVISALCFPSL